MSKDPINGTTSPNAETLFRNLAQVCSGFSTQDVINAGLNLAVNSLRQSHATRRAAEQAWDEYTAKAKASLMSCYDSTGRKKGVFSYTQHIIVDHIKLR